MAKIGKVRSSLDQDEEGKLVMTGEEAKDLAGLLGDAAGRAEDISTEKVDGTVILEVVDGKAVVSTSKLKIEVDDDE
jgi:hypothetical protein